MNTSKIQRDEPTLSSFLHRSLPTELEGLAELALDLRWSGSHASDRLWQILDPEAWERTENPFFILQNVSQSRLEEAAREQTFLSLYRQTLADRRRSLGASSWFAQRAPASELTSVAYFSFEFGLTEALPIYSGGLGMLAGDFLKTASDMGIPMTGIGLLYQQGYFRQMLNADGWQLEAFPYNDPTVLPVVPVQNPDGGWLRVQVWLPGRALLLRVWKAFIGRVTLYLLDSNDPLNNPWDRGITATLYPAGQGLGQERRLIQEIVLGIGGWNVLEALGIEPDVCHLNEGHAAFVTIARARSLMHKRGITFTEALWATRVGNIFTTHTAVPAGFDRFDPALIRQYAEYFASTIGVPMEALLDMGRSSHDPDERLNIAYFAMRSVGQVNAVSKLHASVSQRIFQELFPHWPQPEIPVTYVTNGVHLPSWDADTIEPLWNRVCEEYPCLGMTAGLEPSLDSVAEETLWNARAGARQKLIAYVRRRLARQVQEHAASPDTVERTQHVLDPNALTLGFARRFTGYKRPALLLHDPERLMRLLLHGERPVQLIVAGKAHPNDEEGKRMVQAMAQFAARPELRDRFIFLEDYDIALMQELAAGVDLWINTPRRPWEACGTSGMKLLVNGGLNLSTLDGWWAEAYSPEVGWALGDGQEHAEPEWDTREAEQLYDLLEHQVIPAFYERDATGIPHSWITRIRASMGLVSRFSSYRMLREYVEQLYEPAASAYHRRIAGEAELARSLQGWQAHLEANWRGLRFGEVRVTPEEDAWCFEAQVYFGDLDSSSVRVELYAEPQAGEPTAPIVMQCKGALTGAVNGFLYTASVPKVRPAEHYTPRIVSFHPEALLPLEEAHILWQR